MFKSNVILARVGGVEIGLNWSWLIVFIGVIWEMTATVFPSLAPGLSGAEYALMALAATLLFFVSLALHELAHALQARQDGVESDGVTLWLFGGVTKFRSGFPSARAEFRMAVAGPLVTFLIATAALLVIAFVPMAAPPKVVLTWLVTINIILLLFNLLPGFPLDGGRIMRAALWQRRQDFASATHTASVTGVLFGQLLIIGGILLSLITTTSGGIWVALIGAFLLVAARGEEKRMKLQSLLQGMTVASVMRGGPETIPATATLDGIAAQVLGGDRKAYAVNGADGVTGVLTRRAVEKTPEDMRATTAVEAKMLPLTKTPVFHGNEDLYPAVLGMLQTRQRQALVMEGDTLLGLLSVEDVMKLRSS